MEILSHSRILESSSRLTRLSKMHIDLHSYLSKPIFAMLRKKSQKNKSAIDLQIVTSKQVFFKLTDSHFISAARCYPAACFLLQDQQDAKAEEAEVDLKRECNIIASCTVLLEIRH